jgi:endonuclease/exonuclease/phosphatase family metal-dependent hydrolase
MASQMRVLTLNLWGRQGDWLGRRSALKRQLAELEPDLVAFQESVVLPDYDQVIDLLGAGFQVIHQAGRASNGTGISIASRLTVHSAQELDLHVTPRTGEFPCGALLAEVVAPEPVGRVLFVNHFPNWQLDFERERELQAVTTARRVDELLAAAESHVVIAGDFDADPSAASIRFWCGRQSLEGFSVCYRDAWESRRPGEPGETFTPRNPLVSDWDWPFRRIDYVLVRCGEHGGPTLRIAGCQRFLDEPVAGVWASDHFGLVADLAVPDVKPSP